MIFVRLGVPLGALLGHLGVSRGRLGAPWASLWDPKTVPKVVQVAHPIFPPVHMMHNMAPGPRRVPSKSSKTAKRLPEIPKTTPKKTQNDPKRPPRRLKTTPKTTTFQLEELQLAKFPLHKLQLSKLKHQQLRLKISSSQASFANFYP